MTDNRPTLVRGAIDLAAIGVLLAIALVSLQPTWGSWGIALPAGGGILAGLAVAGFGAWRRWGILPMAALTIVVFLLVVGPLALPETTIAGVVPTGQTLLVATLGVVVTWKQYLTAAIPVSAFEGMGLVPLVIALLGAVLAGSLALRVKPAAWTLLPLGVAAGAAIAFGAPQAAWPLAQSIAFLVIAAAWLAYRAAHDAGHALAAATPRAVTVRRALMGGALLALAGLVTTGAAAALPAPEHRDVLREHVVPPLDLRNYHSPLAGFRQYHKVLEKKTLFQVTGLPAGARLRLATMDAYDGLVYNVAGVQPSDASGAFRHVGDVLNTQPPAHTTTLGVTVRSDASVWLPGGGDPTRIDFTSKRASQLTDSLYFNSGDGQLIATAGLAPGDAYRLTTAFPAKVPPSKLAGAKLASQALPVNQGVPDVVQSVATKLVGDADDPVGQVTNITEGLSKGGFFSHGLDGEAPSLPGHSASRISALLSATQMIGDDEQYATAAALMARSLDIPARVVLGFYPDEDKDVSKGWDVTGNDAHAWIEVNFAGYGWVPFDPTPPPDQVPETQVPQTRNDPKPQVLQPPPPPEEPAEVPPETVQDAPPNQKDKLASGLWLSILIGAGATLGGLVILSLPFLAVVAVKALRRRRRRRDPDLSRRFAGGFVELCDRARDFGTPLPPSATRLVTGAAIANAHPASQAVGLALAADRATFGPCEPTAQDAEGYWATLEESLDLVGQGSGRWRRIRAACSLASLRRRHENRKSKRGIRS